MCFFLCALSLKHPWPLLLPTNKQTIASKPKSIKLFMYLFEFSLSLQTIKIENIRETKTMSFFVFTVNFSYKTPRRNQLK
jgi:hypothetical protein